MAHTIELVLATKVTIKRSIGLGWELRGKLLVYRQPAEGELDLGTFSSERKETPSELIGQFLAIERGDLPALFSFLEQSGIWDIYENEFTPEYFWCTQERVRAIVTRKKLDGWSPQELLESELEDFRAHSSFIAEPGRGPAGIEIELADTYSAIVVGCWMEWAGGIRRAYCLRPDCPDHRPGRIPFELTRPDRRYCSQYCAHLEALRKSRAEARSTERKPRGKTRRNLHTR